MSRKRRAIFLIIIAVIVALLTVLSFLVADPNGHSASIQEIMKDSVLHEGDKINFLKIKLVNPGFISAITVTAIATVFSVIVRIFVIPKFKRIPGKFQIVLEATVGLFDNLAKSNSPHKNGFLGAYVFTAGAYIFLSTLFELFGFQAITATGHSVTLPAPLADINGAIAMGLLSYLIIMSGGIAANGFKGIGQTLKDFSLPISMSFRLFGALLSGALVTELVYHYTALSFGLPVIVGVLFTLLHALIQAYVLTMLTALFYGEVSEKHDKKTKQTKKA